MSREILFLVLTAHYYVRRVSSSQSVSVVVTREASYVFLLWWISLSVVVGLSFLSLSRISFGFNVVAGIFF
jgi:hypothetical protein